MEIFFVTERFHPLYGGAENRYLELAKELSARGHSINIITGLGDIIKLYQFSRKDSLFNKHQIYNNIQIHRIFNYTNNLDHTRSIKDCIQLGIHSAKFINRRIKKASDIDIIDLNIVPYLHLPFFDILIKTKYIVTWHEVIGLDWKDWGFKGKIGSRIERINANLGMHKITVSDFTKSKLKIISKKSNITTIKNGVSEKFFDVENISKEGMNLLYIGRLEPHKNILNILIPSFLDLLRYYPNATLRIAGTGSEQMKIKDIANIYPNMHYYGKIDESEKLNLFSISNLFLLTSNREGSGIAVLEANASGLPVVTINFPNNSVAFEGVINGINGWVASIDNLKEVILFVFENLDKMRKSSRRHAMKFTWKIITDDLQNLYYQLL